ncbi:MAG: 2-hydroxychromene-2-carboxylate isomerase [Ramlibacter sp.]
MSRHVDYYFAPQSPWTYLGHERFAQIVGAARATLRVLPVDLGRIFPLSGGLPLGKRAPQRQAYRLVDLKRFSEQLKVPLNLHPRFFPVSGDDAARLITTVDLQDGTDAAMALSGAVLGAVWAQERNIADAQVLAQLLAACGLADTRLEEARSPAIDALYQAHTQEAIDAGVFGAPTYVVDGELFWGQDRLDFVQQRLHP